MLKLSFCVGVLFTCSSLLCLIFFLVWRRYGVFFPSCNTRDMCWDVEVVPVYQAKIYHLPRLALVQYSLYPGVLFWLDYFELFLLKCPCKLIKSRLQWAYQNVIGFVQERNLWKQTLNGVWCLNVHFHVNVVFLIVEILCILTQWSEKAFPTKI